MLLCPSCNMLRFDEESTNLDYSLGNLIDIRWVLHYKGSP